MRMRSDTQLSDAESDKDVQRAVGRGSRGRLLSPKSFVGLFFFTAAIQVAVFALYPSWFAITPTRIDPWVYWGTGQAFPYISEHFPFTYYFRRWTITLLYAALNLLGISGFWSLILVSSAQLLIASILMFMVCRRFIRGQFMVWVTGLIMMVNPFTVETLGSGDYQGQMVIWLLASLLLVLGPKQTAIRIPWFLSGFAFLLAVLSYQVAALLALVFVFLAFQGAARRIWKIARGRLVFFGLGSLAGVSADWVVGRLVGARWENLLPYTLSVEGSLRNSGDWGIPLLDLTIVLFSSPLSLLPLFILVMGLGLVFFRKLEHRTRLLFGSIPPTFLVFFYMSTGGSNAFGNPHTSFPLFLLMVLTGATVLDGLFPQFRDSIKEVGAAAVLSAAVLFGSRYIPTSSLAIWGIAITAFVTVFLLVQFRPPTLKTNVLRLTLFICVVPYFLVVSFPANFWGSYRPFHLPERFHSVESLVESVEEDVKFAARVGTEEEARIWLQDNRDWPGWSPVVSSMYGGWSAFALQSNPISLDCDRVPWITSQEKSIVVVYDDEDFSSVHKNLNQMFAECTAHRLEKIDYWSEVGRHVFLVRE